MCVGRGLWNSVRFVCVCRQRHWRRQSWRRGKNISFTVTLATELIPQVELWHLVAGSELHFRFWRTFCSILVYLRAPTIIKLGEQVESMVEVSILSSKTTEKATIHAVKTPVRLGFRQSVIETLPLSSYVILGRFLNHWKLQLPEKRKRVYRDSSVFWNRHTTFAKFSVNPRMSYIYSYNIYIFS